MYYETKSNSKFCFLNSKLTSDKYAEDPLIDSNMFFAVRLPTSAGDNGKGYVGGMCCSQPGWLKYHALIVEYEDSDVTFGRVSLLLF